MVIARRLLSRQNLVGMHQLLQYFTSGQITKQPHGPRRTKGAAHGTTNLGTDAQTGAAAVGGVGIVVAHQDTFHDIAVVQFNSQFSSCSVT
jgi:hypothetical protein